MAQGMPDSVARQQAEMLHTVQLYKRQQELHAERSRRFYWAKIAKKCKEQGITLDEYLANSKRGRKPQYDAYDVSKVLVKPAE